MIHSRALFPPIVSLLHSLDHFTRLLFPQPSTQMQPTRRGFTARWIPCRFSNCGRWFKSATGLKTHLHAAHGHDLNVPDDAEQSLPPDVVQEYHENLTGLLSPLIFVIIKSYHTGNVCDENGINLPEGTPPLPHTPQGQDDWTPYRNQLEFETAKHFFSNAQMPAGEIDNILYLWGLSLATHRDKPLFADHRDLYETIDSTPISDAPWRSFGIKYQGSHPSRDLPSWMNQTYDIWYRNPCAIIKNIFSNTDFDGEIDYVPYHDFSEDGSRKYKDFMSGDWAWEQVVSNISIITMAVVVNNSLSRTKLPKILKRMRQHLSLLFLGATKPPFQSPQARMNTGLCIFLLGMYRTMSGEHIGMPLSSSAFYPFQKVCKYLFLFFFTQPVNCS